MKHMLVAMGVLGFVCLATTAQAQEDLKKLAAWNGEWTFEVQGKDSKDGEEWTIEVKGKQHQLGDYFFVWNSKWKAPDGQDMTVVAISGWDPAKKTYFGVGFSSDGTNWTSVVTFGNDTITYDDTGTRATGEETRTRCTFTLPKDEYEGTCETLTDGEWWVSSTDKGVRVK